MLTLPNAIVALLVPFATLFTNPTWRKAQVLLIGDDPDPGPAHRGGGTAHVMGRGDRRDYARYHEVLNRAVWSSRQAARILLVLLLQHLDRGDGPLIFGIDETVERPSRSPDQGSGHLPGRGAFQPPATGQGQRLALDLPDVAGTRPLGRPPLGPAGAHRAGAIDAVLPAAGTPTQEAHRLGTADDPATPLMVSLPNHAGCRSVHWCWWATKDTPCWICFTAANPSVNPLPSLPDYGWTPLSMRQRSPSAGSAGPPAAERRAATLAEGPPRPAPGNLGQRGRGLV